MFTGLVEIMGTVSSIKEQDNSESGGNGWTITVSDATEILTDCHLGDSIAINGTNVKEKKRKYYMYMIFFCIHFCFSLKRYLLNCY